MSKKFWIALSVGLLVTACNKGELKTVQQQQVGDYTLTVLSETGKAKNGANDFTLEFRKTADNQLADVGPVEVAPVMEMQGMAPMMGSATVMPAEKPGQYHVTSNLTMAGMWKFNVKFGDQSVRINMNAE
jgi:YtkA-like